MTITKIEGSKQLKFVNDMSMLDAIDGTSLHKITNLKDPTSTYDAVNKNYLDAALATLTVKDSVRAATTAALPSTAAIIYSNGTAGVGATLTRGENGTLGSIDGVALVVDDRLLVKDQASGLQNGIYKVTDVGSGSTPYVLTRTTDCDESDTEVRAGVFVFVTEGTSYNDTGWLLITNNPITVGTTALTWEQAAGSSLITAGDGLIQNGNAFDINVDGSSHLEIVSDVLRVTSDVVVNADYVVRETPSGTVNGTNTSFTMGNTPIVGSETLFMNGLLQDLTNDYTISGSVITFVAAPVSGDKIRVNYLK